MDGCVVQAWELPPALGCPGCESGGSHGRFDAGFRIEGFGLPARKLGGGADDVKHKNSTETMSDALEVTSDRLRLRVHLGSGYRRCGRNNGAIHF